MKNEEEVKIFFRNSVTSLWKFLSKRCFKTFRVCNEIKLYGICTLKKIYFLYLCLTTILTNSYLQKFCILTSGPSLIIRVVRFIAIRALKIMYFLLLQYVEREMFCSAESDEDELILLTHCRTTRRFSILFYFCHRRLLWGTTPEILRWKSPILALFHSVWVHE